MTTLAQFKAARATLAEADFTQDGTPKMQPLNKALKALGADAIKAADRVKFEEREAAEPDTTEFKSVRKPQTADYIAPNQTRDPIVLRAQGKVVATYREGDPVDSDHTELLKQAAVTLTSEAPA